MRTEQWRQGSMVGLRPRIDPVKNRIRAGGSEIVKNVDFYVFLGKLEPAFYRVSRKKSGFGPAPHAILPSNPLKKDKAADLGNERPAHLHLFREMVDKGFPTPTQWRLI